MLINKTSVFVILLSFLYFSCGESEIEQIDDSLYDLELVTDFGLISDFQSKMDQQTNGRILQDLNFDETQIFEIINDESSVRQFISNQKNFDESNSSNFGISMAMDESGSLGSPMIVQTEKLGNGVFAISYFDSYMNPLVSIELDNGGQVIRTTKNSDNLNGRIECGQETADCIDHVYTQMGWWSVAIIIETAFIPATAVVVAGVCAVGNCFN